MDLVTLAVGIPAYLAIGRLLGKLTLRELRRETPSEELNVLQKSIRLLLFPCAYWDWKNRVRTFSDENNVTNPGCYHFLLTVCRRKKEEGDLVAIYDASGEEKYYRIITLLWPFKLFRAFFGALEIAFFAMTGFARGLVALPYVAGAPLRWLKNRGVFTKLPEASELQYAVQTAWEQFAEQTEQLKALEIEARTRLAKITNALERCKSRKNEWEEGDADLRERFRGLENMLARELMDAEEQYFQAQQAVSFFEENRGRLEALRELLGIYTDVHSARLNTDADRQKTLSAIFATQAACSQLFRKISDAERSAMVRLDMDLDDIASATARNEEAADGIEKQLLV
ncbi:MAG: hypothetical protein HYT22_02845 [Candidatus Niyogibacteria bacterium]|nr:hypothetical protein [Candidatus Niyogibacteria bacterium]